MFSQFEASAVGKTKRSNNTWILVRYQRISSSLIFYRKHGTFRPSLGKLVASNTDEKVATATKDAFSYYATAPNDIKGVLEKLAAPLKGVGPATASLLLAVHDPAMVIFFSDELYRWLLYDGKKATPKYTAKEFESMYSKANDFMDRLNCTPIELEKVAFVIIKESESVKEAAEKYVPTGKPRGRPSESETEIKAESAEPKKRGRPAKVKEDSSSPVAKPSAASIPATKKPGRPSVAASGKSSTPAKQTGRPSLAAASDAATPASKKRGRPSMASLATPDTVATPASKKRGRPSMAASSDKKTKL